MICGLVWLHKGVAKGMCFKNIGVCAQIITTILGSTINIFGGHGGRDSYDQLMSRRISALVMNRYSYQ